MPWLTGHIACLGCLILLIATDQLATAPLLPVLGATTLSTSPASGHRIARVSVIRDRGSKPAAGSAANATARRMGRVQVGDLLAVAGLIAGAGVIEFFLRHLLTRPFYYDEASRAYEISQGGAFLSHLGTAAAPLSLGWVGIETAARLVLGDTEAGLRAPMFAALPLLGVATYLLGRRWLGPVASFCAAALLLGNGWIVNYALQLKSYSYEGLFAVAAVGVYLLAQRTTWRRAQLIGLYAALGLTCVFSLPNLLVVGPLLALDLFRTIRGRDQAAWRVAGAALAGVIALVHYVAFVSPQAGVADTGFFTASYAPHGIGPFLRFAAAGFGSYVPSMVIGVAGGAANAAPSYPPPPAADGVLIAVTVILLAAGLAAVVRDADGRALVTAAGGAVLLELAASTVRRWPFGLLRVNIFVLPLLYILCAIGAVWLARALIGPRGADGTRPVMAQWWRAVATMIAGVAVIVAAAGAGVSTARTFADTSRLAVAPIWFGATRAAVAEARSAGAPGDLVVIRADRTPPDWYAAPWLYYMDKYQGFPAAVAARPPIPAGHTLAVVYVTPRAVARFLAAHPGSPVVFLLEYDVPGATFPRWVHRQSLHTLRRYGYCSAREIPLRYTGALTIVRRTGC
jgi:hypothetical protein